MGERLTQVAEFIKTLVRPTVTLLLVSVVSVLVLRDQSVADWYQNLAVAAVSYWFASRNNKQGGQ